ncbi:MAG: hypothetical protein ACQR33_04180 [Candidatus Saccharibacteria bacterium]
MADDFVTLDPSLRYTDTAIVDEIIGVRHALHYSAQPAMRALTEGVTYQNLCSQSRAITVAQLQDLLGFLNLIGGLHIKRSFGQIIRTYCSLSVHVFYGATYPPLSRRYPATLYGVTRASVRACRSVVLTSGLVAVAAGLSGIAKDTTLLSLYFSSASLFLSSIIAHEWVHILCIEQSRRQSIVVQKGAYLRTIHQKISRGQELYVAVAGPCAGVFVASIGTTQAFATYHVPFAIIGCLTTVAHMASLLPWYADGKSVVHALLSKREIYP